MPPTSPQLIADLGCGTGHLTRGLAERWPAARVIGVDSSPNMLADASGRVEFVQADLADWSPPGPVDLLVSNAALHWLPDHAALFDRLAGWLAPGGTLAVQLPDRGGTPSHVAVEETCADPRWAADVADVGLHRDSVRPLAWYAQRLLDRGLTVNAWTTTYLHLLHGNDAVLTWLKGTALRPLLAKLGDRAADFERDLAGRLRAAYPSVGGVTLFAMPRAFLVATRHD